MLGIAHENSWKNLGPQLVEAICILVVARLRKALCSQRDNWALEVFLESFLPSCIATNQLIHNVTYEPLDLRG